jgi:signal transduction histidine kinase
MIKKNIYLLLFVLMACLMLIIINNYTIKILSGVRAYINGESEYSKGQKDALLFLSTFIATEDTAYLRLFNASIKVPMNDNLARESLLNNEKDEVVFRYFAVAQNHPADIPDMIWLFKTFRTTYMKTPIQIWSEADTHINNLYIIGTEVGNKIQSKSLSSAEKLAAVKKISTISANLYELESRFSKVLNDKARKINDYLLWANIICILFIVGNIAIFAGIMIRRLNKSNLVLKAKNDEVIETNKELDTLVYSISHDLRSPITSIKGLLNVLRDEDDLARLKEFADDLDNIVSSQDIFILEIIDFFRSKRSTLSYTEFSLKKLIDTVIANNRFIPAARDITIHQQIALDTVYTDELRLKIIINNLLSNAIKYSDGRKSDRVITIKTRRVHDNIEIEIEDNGIGIDKKHIDKIYNMFYSASPINKGTGLGLYILKQNVSKLQGKVDARSELNVGTKFTVVIPLANSNHTLN